MTYPYQVVIDLTNHEDMTCIYDNTDFEAALNINNSYPNVGNWVNLMKITWKLSKMSQWILNNNMTVKTKPLLAKPYNYIVIFGNLTEVTYFCLNWELTYKKNDTEIIK